MITSPSGKKMIGRISPIYANSEIEQAIYQAIGTEWDSVYDLVDEILLQLFPQTATWGLVFWEQRNNLPTNLNEDIEIRRKKVIAKMQTRYPMNPQNMAMILKNYVDSYIEIIENIAPHTFEVKLISKKGFSNLEDLYKAVKKIKSSHLSTKYNLISAVESQLNYGLAALSGEEITIYPRKEA